MASDVSKNEIICMLEGVVYYVDPKSPGALSFSGGKERIRVPLTTGHVLLAEFRKHVIQHAGLKEEAEKRGLGKSIDVKLCRLIKFSKAAKSNDETRKAISINTQAQWDTERPVFTNSDLGTSNTLQGEGFQYVLSVLIAVIKRLLTSSQVLCIILKNVFYPLCDL